MLWSFPSGVPFFFVRELSHTLLMWQVNQKIPILAPQLSDLGFTTIWYGNGFVSKAVMGGMWSLSRLTMLIILRQVFCRDFSMAARTLIRSVE
jgi:hypothetical protein